MKSIFNIFVVLLLFCTYSNSYAATQQQLETNALNISIEAVTPENISFSYENLPADTEIYMVDSIDAKSFQLKLKKLKRSSDRIINVIPNAVINAEYRTQYKLEARDPLGTVIAASEYFPAGGLAKNAPNCTIKANKYKVAANENFIISWAGTNAEYALGTVGFSKSRENDRLQKKGQMKLQSSLSGIRTYSLIFQGESGSQESCTVFIYVEGTDPSATINQKSLTSSSAKPKLSGTASNVKKIMVIIGDHEVAGGQVWASKPITVRNGLWSVKVTPSLPYKDYAYSVEVLAYDNGQYTQLVNGQTLVIN